SDLSRRARSVLSARPRRDLRRRGDGAANAGDQYRHLSDTAWQSLVVCGGRGGFSPDGRPVPVGKTTRHATRARAGTAAALAMRAFLFANSSWSAGLLHAHA